MNKFIFLLATTLLLVACEETSSTKVDIDPLYGNLPEELIKDIEQIAPKIQTFDLDPTKHNSIVCDSGTEVHIPKNSIVDISGDDVTGKITMEVKEHYSKSDYLLSNLQTVHNDQLLETGGMIYFNAYDNKGNQLKIADGKSIRIEASSNIGSPDFFIGKRDENGLINWGEMKESSKTLTSYPILYISQHHLPEGYATECPEYYGIVSDPVTDWRKHYYIQGDILKYEKTILATKEFKMRYDRDCQPELVNLYIDNLDKNLWEIDEMVVDKLIQDSLEAAQMEHNSMTKDLKRHNHELIEAFRKFAAQKLEKVDSSIVTDTSTIENYTDSYDSYLKIYRAKSAFDAIEFGWINLDVIYDDPRSVEMDINVLTTNNPSTVYLILKDRNVLLNAQMTDENSFSFTKNKDGYNKLPKGAKASLVAIGYGKNKIMYGMKDIVIGKNESEKLSLKAITVAELKNNLVKLK